MNLSCYEVQSQLSTWLDSETTPELNHAIDAHLIDCAQCRAALESIQFLDSSLSTLSAHNATSANRIAENVLAILNSPPVTPATTASQPVFRVSSPNIYAYLINPLLGAAAGFVLACLILPQPANHVARNNTPSPSIFPTQPEPSIARLVATTGNIEYRQPGQQDWSALQDSTAFQCQPGSEIRTMPGVRCEVQMSDQSTLRLNEATEVTFRSPQEIELRAGQLWCNSNSSSELLVVAASSQISKTTPDPLLCFTCPSNSSFISEVDSQGGCRIQSATNAIDITLGEKKQTLKRGEIARFENGQLSIEPHYADSLLSTSWMQPLLVMKGHEDAELGDRVNKLLANLGRSKMDNLYEEEIRSLGDFAVLPLLRFIQSEDSKQSPDQRLRAMSIVSDIAPTWLIGDLIELLNDPTPQIRVASATALKRLTRQSQGIEPEQWSIDQSELQTPLNQWRIWWQENKSRFEQKQKRSVNDSQAI